MWDLPGARSRGGTHHFLLSPITRTLSLGQSVTRGLGNGEVHTDLEEVYQLPKWADRFTHRESGSLGN